MMRDLCVIGGMLAGLAAIGPAAEGAVLSYEATLAPVDGDSDRLRLTIANTSEAGSLQGLSSVRLELGDTTFNFDRFVAGSADISPGAGGTIQAPDHLEGSARSDWFHAIFNGLVSGRSCAITLELDPDSGEDSVNFANVLFNNGPAANATLSVSFQDGQDLFQTLPDGISPDGVYTFTQATPEPAMAALVMVPAALLRRRRRR